MDSGSRVNNIEINKVDMQSLQDAFCMANDMYIMCMSKNHGPMTSFSGSKLEEDFVDQFFSYALRQEIVDSFIDGDAENIIERQGTENYLIYRGVAIRGENGAFLGVWLCFGVDEGLIPEDVFVPSEIRRTSLKDFEKSLSLLETLTKYYFAEKVKAAELLKDLDDQKDAAMLMEHRLMKNEIMTEILRIMESENSFSKISEDIAREAGQYIGATHVSLLQIAPDAAIADMVTEWNRGDAAPMIASFQGVSLKDLPFMNGKPYTVSSDSILPESFAVFFEKTGINAGIFLPLEVNDQAGMYLCILSVGEDRKWSVDDLKFANDIKRILHTILIKRITKNSLASSYAALEAILQNTGCGVAVSDVRRRQTLYVNDAFESMFENEIDRLAVDDILYDSDNTLTRISGYAANGSGKWYNISYSTITWVDGREVRLSTFYDVSELKTYQKRIEKQASEDLLTGLFNRQRCEKDIDAEAHFVTKTDKEFAVLMIDLDDFDNINTGLGHENGDSLLRFIAHAINGISLIHDKCYRVGGDEFVIVVDHEIYDKLDFIIKRVTNLFDNPWIIEEKEFYCTMSMGCVRIPQEASDVKSIMTGLNVALTEAKKNGKNRVQFYDQKVDTMAASRIEKERAMREAVEDACREFDVYYQPIIEINKDGSPCCGAEALVRWNSINLGFLGPGEFVELAEYLGLINKIGEHVLLQACKTCKHWNDFGHPEYKVNVNFSVVQLVQTDIVDVVRNVLQKTAIDPHNLTIEVTESLAIEDMTKMVNVLSDLRAIGCRVALDDFGTGYSSLNHIRQMPIDTIKIDKAFVQNIGADGYYETFIKTVSEMAASLDMDVCCEGIETGQQLEAVQKYSVNVAQGYLFDKPLTQAEFEKKYL